MGTKETMPRRAHARRAFTMIEMLVVAAVVAVFASLVIPSLAGAGTPSASVLEPVIEADLQRARTEAMARGKGVSLVVAADGSRWWLAQTKDASTPIDGTMREFGRGSLVPFAGMRLSLTADADDAEPNGARVLAAFDANGARDESLQTLEFGPRNARKALGRWSLAPGRARLTRE